ncbi:MAG TPA: SIS domain-containing protein [Candidatus Dormibacteraeota bacterium]|jgi:D-sedoheptulose 7-phosphate isomerase|nr:SIS domain-containing protein [Candidatus Dormibacteraeota bacterium]
MSLGAPPRTRHVGGHLDRLVTALRANAGALRRVDGWGEHVASVLLGGGRLLAAGNGGSAAQAQHLTAELVGRYLEERQPFSAIALHAETSSLTALCNDYGHEQAFARAVRAHGRPGDVLVALSTSGRSTNVLAAVEAARDVGLQVYALTGPAPNPLADSCQDVAAVEAESTATVQEVHLVAVHMLCAAIDRTVARVRG